MAGTYRLKSLRGWKMSRRADEKADKTAWRTAAKPTGAVLHPTAKGKAAAGSKPDLAIVKTKPATQQIAPASAIYSLSPGEAAYLQLVGAYEL